MEVGTLPLTLGVVNHNIDTTKFDYFSWRLQIFFGLTGVSGSKYIELSIALTVVRSSSMSLVPHQGQRHAVIERSLHYADDVG